MYCSGYLGVACCFSFNKIMCIMQLEFHTILQLSVSWCIAILYTIWWSSSILFLLAWQLCVFISLPEVTLRVAGFSCINDKVATKLIADSMKRKDTPHNLLILHDHTYHDRFWHHIYMCWVLIPYSYHHVNLVTSSFIKIAHVLLVTTCLFRKL